MVHAQGKSKTIEFIYDNRIAEVTDGSGEIIGRYVIGDLGEILKFLNIRKPSDYLF